MLVTKVEGERATYDVLGHTLTCSGECRFTYSMTAVASPRHAKGDPCPKCGQPLRHAPYRVDLKLYGGLGWCGCHRWQFFLQPLVTRLAPEARVAAAKLGDDLKCHHIVAALRHYATDKLVAEPSDGEGAE